MQQVCNMAYFLYTFLIHFILYAVESYISDVLLIRRGWAERAKQIIIKGLVPCTIP